MQDSTGRTCKNRFPTIRREDRSTVLSPYLSRKKGTPKNFYSRLGRRAKPALIGTLKHVRGVKVFCLLREGRPKNFDSHLGRRAKPALMWRLKHIQGVVDHNYSRKTTTAGGEDETCTMLGGHKPLAQRGCSVTLLGRAPPRKTTTAGGEGKIHTMFGGYKPPARRGCSVTLLSR